MIPENAREILALRRLARRRGIQASYYDILHRRISPPPETLLAVLRALGEPLETFRDAKDALRAAEASGWDRLCPPVCVAWNGGPAELELRVPCAAGNGRVRIRAAVEGGEALVAERDLSASPVAGSGKGSAAERVAIRVSLPWSLPPGYHDVRVETRDESGSTTVISAPLRAWAPEGGAAREWGVFLPLYALHSGRSLGAGDLTDLRALMDWVEEIGGDMVGTLPLLASCSPEPFNPSPYSPGSRLAWNEFYLDVSRVPGFGECRPAMEMFSSEAFRAEADRLRGSPLVDYRRGMELKRRLLGMLAEAFFSGGGGAAEGFRRFLSENTFMEDYAAFRAAWDSRKAPWPAWPAPLRDGVLREGDFDEADKRYHLFVQWAIHLQLRELSAGSRVRLYLDLPLGTSYDGFDVWRRRDDFALRASAGAPPDDFFTKGQDWGFPPLHPERTRADGHAYFRACIANQLRYAGILRIDHVMGLHRFFWIPNGAGPSEGTYVKYPAEELYAVLCVESHRHRARIVGEDLGTVPPYVRPAMARHGLRRMFVVQYGLKPDPVKAMGKIPKASLACVNTHDMPPFASFRKALDVEERVALGILDKADAGVEKAARAKLTGALAAFLRKKGLLPRTGGDPDAGTLLRACLAHIAGSEAEMLVVGLEDLWHEEIPQNTPGTSTERPNWVRKSRYSLEEFRGLPGVAGALREIARIREGGSQGCDTK
ncbi:MAG: 4-alpha-glucanotransferase [Deltaproteobacteria bacterium]|nr:4-alpha-glucanotransferase [Deltaproteobacteria bacterium]